MELAREPGAARRLKSAKLRHDACIADIDYRAAPGLEKTVIRELAKEGSRTQKHEVEMGVKSGAIQGEQEVFGHMASYRNVKSRPRAREGHTVCPHK